MRGIITCPRGIRRAIFAIVFVLLINPAHAQAQPTPSNRLVVIMDSSGSFRSRQSDALKQVIQLLDTMAQRKLHRWESNTGEIFILAMDAMPEVVWKGSLRDLKALEPKNWAERFASRKDLSYCTDVQGAFGLAAKELVTDTQNVSKYLFVFSDLMHEPPTTSVRKCSRPTNTPPEEFPWESFSDVSVTLFWVPADNKLVWQRAIKEHGLDSNFAIYSTTQSEVVEVTPPPQPERTLSSEEQESARNKLFGFGKMVMKGALYVGLGLMGTVVLIMIMGRLKQKSPASGRPRHGSIRRPPLAGQGGSADPQGIRPIRPLPLDHGRRN